MTIARQLLCQRSLFLSTQDEKQPDNGKQSSTFMKKNDHPFPWLLFGAELTGTALLIAIGLSVVILAFGQDSFVIHYIPDPGLRRLVTGFLFGTTGALIALSPLGRESGAHINPAVTLAFLLMGKLRIQHAIIYLSAQLAGAVAGSVPLLLWGPMGRSVGFGATIPGSGYGAGWALLGETLTTFALITGIFLFLGHRRIRAFTPALFPILYAVMVFLEAPVSGTSTNPARSLGPALISGNWQDWWIYWLGPLLGTLMGVALYRSIWLQHFEVKVAKLYHFEHDRYAVFQKQ
jgi:aquaporin Z